jgi:hypothetical protein
VIDDYWEPVDEPQDDPAGGVRIPLTRREIARTRALVGLAVGVVTVVGFTTYWTPGTTTL